MFCCGWTARERAPGRGISDLTSRPPRPPRAHAPPKYPLGKRQFDRPRFPVNKRPERAGFSAGVQGAPITQSQHDQEVQWNRDVISHSPGFGKPLGYFKYRQQGRNSPVSPETNTRPTWDQTEHRLLPELTAADNVIAAEGAAANPPAEPTTEQPTWGIDYTAMDQKELEAAYTKYNHLTHNHQDNQDDPGMRADLRAQTEEAPDSGADVAIETDDVNMLTGV